ncbi:MAG: hypothetical protein K6F00_11350 [Lachnospiraceae bacterium]|nr:hypothetical protein [Lachnospiraceae bacterium]
MSMKIGAISGGYGSYGGYEELKPGQKPGYESAPSDCDTCKHRKYKDGSDEQVSFKTAQHISPQASGAAVRAHEGEHVANAYKKAAQTGGRVISCGVSIHQAVCPECGRVYTSGGLTTTVTAEPKDDGKKDDPYSRYKASLGSILNTGINYDTTT